MSTTFQSHCGKNSLKNAAISMFYAANVILPIMVTYSLQWNNPNQDEWPLKVIVWPEIGNMSMTTPSKIVLKVWVATVHVLNLSQAVFHY